MAPQDSEYVFHDALPVASVAEGAGQAVEVEDRVVAIFCFENEFYAIDDACPHMGASLASGCLEGSVVACPWHAWRFDVRDGTWVDNPRIKTDSYPTRVVDGMIQVGLPKSVSGAGQGGAQDVIDQPDVVTNTVGASTVAEDVPVVGAKRELSLTDFQRLIRDMYYEKDLARGVEGTFMWLMEEVGELSSALRERDRKNQEEEFADVLAWLCTIANVCEIDLTEAIRMKYGEGCPGCGRLVCVCPDTEKP